MDPRRRGTPFEVLPWEWSDDDRTLTCRFRSPLGDFAERVAFPPADGQSPPPAEVFDLLALACGTSYFKASPSSTIVAHTLVDAPAAMELARCLYDDGLREYAVHNGFDVPFRTSIEALGQPRETSELLPSSSSALVPMGGGRDSAVVATALAPFGPTLFTVGRNRFVQRQAARLRLPLVEAQRTLDRELFRLNDAGALNGHVPVTAINSLIGCAAALLCGHDAVVMSNEASADHPTTIVDGHPVNHQFSKSSVCEAALRAALRESGTAVEYFSALRPYGELDIARAFARRTGLLGEIMSCNRAFLRDAARRSDGWCGHCAKCRFVFLTLAPFVERETLVRTFGRDLLWSLDDAGPTAELLGSTDRPFDCVGTPTEAVRALRAIAEGEWRNSPLVQHLVATTLEVVTDVGLATAPPVDHTPEPYRSAVAAMFR